MKEVTITDFGNPFSGLVAEILDRYGIKLPVALKGRRKAVEADRYNYYNIREAGK